VAQPSSARETGQASSGKLQPRRHERSREAATDCSPRRKPWGTIRRRRAAPKGRKKLVPNTPRIKFDGVLLQESFSRADTSDAAKRRQNAAHGASRGNQPQRQQAPKERKNAAHGVSRGSAAWEATSPKGRKKLTPNVSLVIVDVVLFEERHKLLLKRMPLVMFLLSGDVFCHLCDIRFADAENPVSSLPCKIRAPSFVNPARRTRFNDASDLRSGMSRSNPSQYVYVIACAADDEGCPLHLAHDASKVGKQIGAEFGLDQRPSPLCGKNEMQQDIAGCMRHKFLAPLRGSVIFSRILPTACAVGCILAPLRRLRYYRGPPANAKPHPGNAVTPSLAKAVTFITYPLWISQTCQAPNGRQNAAHGASRGSGSRRKHQPRRGERFQPTAPAVGNGSEDRTSSEGAKEFSPQPSRGNQPQRQPAPKERKRITFVNFPLHSPLLICYKQLTESSVASRAILSQLSSPSGI